MADGHFKIVAILKKRGSSAILEYSYVPYQWEKDGILYWPKRNILSLRKDPTSMYESDWEQYKCKVKKDNIVGIDEAELWEEEYVNASCTESEETLPIKRHKPNKSIQRPIPSQTSIDKL
ncbi:PREDICTED: uncharacterized protein LOC108770344, partial [Trachymyrmex cornetzi]|uniref:uncharacterized protein LOC108770344 n=1 Tax=Trachymyrmex cornetzi TaxID=471704 RepID=UPI00084EF5B3